MRFVDRNAIDPPEVLTKSNRRGPRETKRASDRFEELPANKKATFKFDFQAYREPEVKLLLRELFEGKCAYCESFYEQTQPVDVEHFRPKGMVLSNEGDEIKPGYFWLAAEWDNLLPSCIDCNRSRKQKIPNVDEPVNLGKANQFPLEDEDDRWLDKDQSSSERPLLLNPCTDNDIDQHLEFEDGIATALSEKGEASIQVYALNRLGLVHARQEVLRLVEQRCTTLTLLLELLDEIDDQDDRLRGIVLDVISLEMDALQMFTEPAAPFSAMAGAIVEQFLEETGMTLPGDGGD